MLGKVIGGGMPLAAFGGRADVMSVLAPDGPVYQAGTLSGNPLATAAGLAVLDQLDEGSYRMLAGRAAELAAELRKVIGEAGLAVQVPVVESLLGIFFAEEEPHDFETAQAADAKTYAALLPRPARARHRPAAEPVRGAVPEPRPHARRARAHRRPRRRRRASDRVGYAAATRASWATAL